jgi:hypothetical protein
MIKLVKHGRVDTRIVLQETNSKHGDRKLQLQIHLRRHGGAADDCGCKKYAAFIMIKKHFAGNERRRGKDVD